LLSASGKLKQNGEEINEMNKIHLDFAASMSKMSLVLAEVPKTLGAIKLK